MIRLYLSLIHGHFRRHRIEFILCLLGVALGTAVVVAIELAVGACVESFRGAVSSLAERSTHAIFASDGAIRDEQYIELTKRKLPAPLAPVIDRSILAARGGGEPGVARLIGVDVFSERSLRSFTQLNSSLDEEERKRFLTQPNQVVLVDLLATRLGAKVGDCITLTIGARRIDVTVCGIVEVAGVARAQLPDLVIADLATAQELTGADGFIDRIDTRLETPEQERELAAALPTGLELRSTRQQSANMEELTRSYRLNLSALSLMASLVAVFIVYNSMLISVRQRAASLGILRCVGAVRWQLGGLYLVEAIVFAITGAALGIVAGALLARGMVGYIATTINDLYAVVRPGPVQLNLATAAKGAAVSVVSCLAGALAPLLAAARTPPINAFRPTEQHRTGVRSSGWLLAIGVALLGAGYAVQFLPTQSPIVGFVMALIIAVGFALVCPWLTRIVSSGIEIAARRFQLLPVQMAASAVGRSLGITGVAVGATMLALAMNISVRTMVFSFRSSLGAWMEQRFAADVFIGPELLVRHRIDATLSVAVPTWVARQRGVSRVVRYRTRTTDIAGKPTQLIGTDMRDVIPMLPMKQSIGPASGFDPQSDIFITEPLAGRAHLKAGDALTLQTPAGPRHWRVYAIFYDFGNERGQVLIDRSQIEQHWHDSSINSLHVLLNNHGDAERVAAEWSTALRANYPIVVSSSHTVKTDVMTIFDRTFAVTEVLTWLAGGVAFCGLAGSLLAVALSRQRDYSVLAAVGMTGRQTLAWVLSQGIIIAVMASAVASIAGTLLAFVLAYVIQYRSFGWSIPTTAQPRFWVQNLGTALAAAGIATIYPAWRLRRLPPAIGLRVE